MEKVLFLFLLTIGINVLIHSVTGSDIIALKAGGLKKYRSKREGRTEHLPEFEPGPLAAYIRNDENAKMQLKMNLLSDLRQLKNYLESKMESKDFPATLTDYIRYKIKQLQVLNMQPGSQVTSLLRDINKLSPHIFGNPYLAGSTSSATVAPTLKAVSVFPTETDWPLNASSTQTLPHTPTLESAALLHRHFDNSRENITKASEEVTTAGRKLNEDKDHQTSENPLDLEVIIEQEAALLSGLLHFLQVHLEKTTEESQNPKIEIQSDFPNTSDQTTESVNTIEIMERKGGNIGRKSTTTNPLLDEQFELRGDDCDSIPVESLERYICLNSRLRSLSTLPSGVRTVDATKPWDNYVSPGKISANVKTSKTVSLSDSTTSVTYTDATRTVSNHPSKTVKVLLFREFYDKRFIKSASTKNTVSTESTGSETTNSSDSTEQSKNHNGTESYSSHSTKSKTTNPNKKPSKATTTSSFSTGLTTGKHVLYDAIAENHDNRASTPMSISGTVKPKVFMARHFNIEEEPKSEITPGVVQESVDSFAISNDFNLYLATNRMMAAQFELFKRTPITISPNENFVAGSPETGRLSDNNRKKSTIVQNSPNNSENVLQHLTPTPKSDGNSSFSVDVTTSETSAAFLNSIHSDSNDLELFHSEKGNEIVSTTNLPETT